MFRRGVIQHDSPSINCSCGFYAQYNGAVLDYQHYGFEGSIQAHGLTILGTKGIRTQFAQIESLYISSNKFGAWPDGRGLPYKIAEYYQVPLFKNRAEWLEAFPPQDVSAIAPPNKVKPYRVQIEDCGLPGEQFAHRVTVQMSDGSYEVYPKCRYQIVDSLDRQIRVECSNEEGISLTLTNVEIVIDRITEENVWSWSEGMKITWPHGRGTVNYRPGRYSLNQPPPIWTQW